jgi:hypothetical protein
MANPRNFRADPLAKRIRLTDERRARLKITTIGSIDVPKKEREKRRKAKEIEQQRARRRKAGAKPRAEYEAGSIEKAKPWEALGKSRATYFRQRQKAEAAAAERSQNPNVIPIETSVKGSNLLLSPSLHTCLISRISISHRSSG